MDLSRYKWGRGGGGGTYKDGNLVHYQPKTTMQQFEQTTNWLASKCLVHYYLKSLCLNDCVEPLYANASAWPYDYWLPTAATIPPPPPFLPAPPTVSPTNVCTINTSTSTYADTMARCLLDIQLHACTLLVLTSWWTRIGKWSRTGFGGVRRWSKDVVSWRNLAQPVGL